MPTLNINGQSVKVDDCFLKLSPDEQNATVDEIAASPGKAGRALAERHGYFGGLIRQVAEGMLLADPHALPGFAQIIH